MSTTHQRGCLEALSREATGVFATDLDGTLLTPDGRISDADSAALERLEDDGVCRVIATGRSLYSFETLGLEGLPVDLLIFATGAGVLRLRDGVLLRSVSMNATDVTRCVDAALELELDFMVHAEVPDNHRFWYHRSSGSAATNRDFEYRLSLYQPFAAPLTTLPSSAMSQLVIVVPPPAPPGLADALRTRLPGCNVIETTSPLDGRSLWLEVFPSSVSKSLALRWVAEQLGIDRSVSAAVGNDTNDVDMLEWVASAFVVSNAPANLRNRFRCVPSHGDSGVGAAIEIWRRNPSMRIR